MPSKISNGIIIRIMMNMILTNVEFFTPSEGEVNFFKLIILLIILTIIHSYFKNQRWPRREYCKREQLIKFLLNRDAL